jgi:hypothetical protein
MKEEDKEEEKREIMSADSGKTETVSNLEDNKNKKKEKGHCKV